MISVKKAKFPNAAVISYLGRQTFTETFGHLFTESELTKYVEDTFSINKLESSLLKPHNIFGLLYYSDEPVGYYKVKIGSYYEGSIMHDLVQLQKIYILKNDLDKKLGKVLLENIFSLNEIKDYETMWVVVLHSNTRAIKFYENHGFKKLKKYYHTIGHHNLEYELTTKNIKQLTGFSSA